MDSWEAGNTLRCGQHCQGSDPFIPKFKLFRTFKVTYYTVAKGAESR